MHALYKALPSTKFRTLVTYIRKTGNEIEKAYNKKNIIDNALVWVVDSQILIILPNNENNKAK